MIACLILFSCFSRTVTLIQQKPGPVYMQHGQQLKFTTEWNKKHYRKHQNKKETYTPYKNCKILPSLESFWSHVERKMQEEMQVSMPISAVSIRKSFQQGYQENRYRLQKVAEKLLNGEGVNIFVIGGSLTAGDGSKCKWSDVLEAQLHEHLDEVSWGKINVYNKAEPGTRAESFLHHMSRYNDTLSTIDLFINEYHFNDAYDRSRSDPKLTKYVDNERRQANLDAVNEQIYLRIASYPQKPAYLFFDTPNWIDESLELKGYSSVHYEVAKQYKIPLLWYVDAVKDSGHLWLIPDNSPHPGKGHPACFPGHDILGSVISGVIHNEMKDVCMHGVEGTDVALDFDASVFKCAANPLFGAFAHDHKQNSKQWNIIQNNGWEFYEDVKGKPGWIANATALAEIVFSIPIEMGDIDVEYLRSYENVGTATCQIEKAEDPSKPLAVINLEGRWDTNASLLEYAKIHVEGPPGKYNLRCKTDGKKFKITGLTSC